MLERSNDSKAGVRECAARLLCHFQHHRPASILAAQQHKDDPLTVRLVQLLTDSSKDVRKVAISHIDPMSALDAVLTRTSDVFADIRAIAISRLAAVTLSAEQRLSLLKHALIDKYASTRNATHANPPCCCSLVTADNRDASVHRQLMALILESWLSANQPDSLIRVRFQVSHTLVYRA